jgi:hypothetical protein
MPGEPAAARDLASSLEDGALPPDPSAPGARVEPIVLQHQYIG